MKLLIALFFVAIVIVQVTSVDLEQEFSDFKVKFKRCYESPEEEQKRKDIFIKTKKHIEEHNKKYDNKEVSYFLGINNFADWSEEEFKKWTGPQEGTNHC